MWQIIVTGWEVYRDAWRKYCAGVPAKRSAAVARIAVGACAFFWMLPNCGRESYAEHFIHVSPEAYNPIGLLTLFGNTLPPAIFFQTFQTIARVSSFLLMLGLFSRVSSIISFFSSCFVVGVYYSFASGWSHGENVVLLAQLSLLFGRTGDALSLDALFKKSSTRGNPIDPAVYFTPVLLGQFSVVLMFFNAFYWKIKEGDYSLAWALSDNLRNHILERYLTRGEAIPHYLVPLVTYPAVYKTVALSNLICQALPILALFATRRPWVRFVAGILVALEILGLGVVMGFWNWGWWLLVALFIDWDRLIDYFKGKGSSYSFSVPKTITVPGTLARSYTLIFIVVNVIVSFGVWGIRDTQLNTFPLSRFDMFSGIHAKKPYSQNFPFRITGVNWEIDADNVPQEQLIFVKNYIQRRSNALLSYMNTPEVLPKYISSWYPYVLNNVGKENYKEMRLYRAVFEFPAAPNPPEARIVNPRLLAKILRDGSIQTYASTE